MMARHRLGAVLLASALLLVIAGPSSAAAREFPEGYEPYHTYAETVAVLQSTVARFPGIARMFSIGRSWEGREIWAIKVSDNVGVDEDEPEIVFDSLAHAREHLTVEMNLYLLRLLTDRYGHNSRVTSIVDSREVFIIPILNPDGGEYDIEGGRFHNWRKNRQPNSGTTAIGTDLNRNFGFKWGCCGGSSGKPGASTYRGPKAWSAPEARVYRDFVASRVVGGRQQIRAAISWHTNGEFVLWPYAYTTANTPRTMSADDHKAMVALGREMARRNGYVAQQASDMYIFDGDQAGWAYYAHRIPAFVFEMYPRDDAGVSWFYPPASVIDRETARNKDAVLYLLEQADCAHRAAGLGATHCGPLNDDLETARGWRVDAWGTDTATDGAWQRRVPQATRTSAGTKQPGSVPSGRNAFVTGGLAGSGAQANDVDGGVTSALSPAIDLSGGSRWTLSLRYSFAHNSKSGSSDWLRVRVVGATTGTVFAIAGTPTERNSRWLSATADLSAYAGQTVRLLVEAADGGADNLVEAALDDVRVYRTP